MALHNKPQVSCKSELVREEYTWSLIANKFTPTDALFSMKIVLQGYCA